MAAMGQVRSLGNWLISGGSALQADIPTKLT
jgi:hypothetical protein